MERTIPSFRAILRYPLLRLYDLVVGMRNRAYDRGFLSAKRLQRPVISVGNLSMGGAGKTPVTAALIELLGGEGREVAVLSRGYGRKNPKTRRHVLPDDDWRFTGDEPLMLAKRFPTAQILVGPNRWEAAQARQRQPDVYILDDGFQHRALHRDVDIVLIDATQPVPAPFSPHLFREHLPALKRAHLVLITRCSSSDDAEPWRTRIGEVNPDIPVFPVGIQMGSLNTLTGDAIDLDGRKTAAFAGIAQPQQFFNTLVRLGITLDYTLGLPDHHALAGRRRAAFESTLRREGITRVLTTHKDAVKLDGAQESDIIYGFLPIDIDWMGAREDILHHIMERVNA